MTARKIAVSVSTHEAVPLQLSNIYIKRAHPQFEDLVTADEIIMKEVVVGLSNGQQQARSLFSEQPISIHPQRKSMQLGLCNATRYYQ